LISNNAARLGKNLWTDGVEGEKLGLYAGYNEHDEARFVVDRVAAGKLETDCYDDNAVLYRTSAQSRVIEEALMQVKIPYRV
ncbi:MAG: DNA helicase II, partial [Gammaproteobacteria bacterium]|nr:DNA helicase II [Gammaproteobacteria bacterium]NIO61523.1 DNA helicase II [Gammaproteobacteria bacterium]